MEKKLRIFDLSQVSPISAATATPQKKMVGNPDSKTNGAADRSLIGAEEGFEVGPGVHKGTIKAIVWTKDPNVLVTAADDKMIRWWDLRSRTVVQEQAVQGDIGSCEFTNVKPQPNDIGGGYPVLVIAAGKTVYFYGGLNSMILIKSVELPYEVASAALHPSQRKFVTGGIKDTWAKVYDYDTEQELGMSRNQPGWS
jgi:serine-threonine kinase receptor-associated protein